MLYEQFRDRIGEIVVGEIHHIRHKHVILLDDEGTNYFTKRKPDSIRFL
jgi:N utilization substance protein A